MRIIERWIIKQLHSWDSARRLVYFAIVLGWFLCFVMSLVVYDSPVDHTDAIGDWVVIIVSILLIGIIEFDLISDALKVTISPKRLEEKLQKLYIPFLAAKERAEWQRDYSTKCLYVRDMCNEFETFWWQQKSYRPLLSMFAIFMKILLMIGFFTLISLSLEHLSNFRSFEGISQQTDFITHFYINAQAMFLAGHDKIVPINDWSRILTIAEEIAGFVTLAVAVVRLITPVDVDIQQFRKVIMWCFQTVDVVTSIPTQDAKPQVPTTPVPTTPVPTTPVILPVKSENKV